MISLGIMLSNDESPINPSISKLFWIILDNEFVFMTLTASK